MNWTVATQPLQATVYDQLLFWNGATFLEVQELRKISSKKLVKKFSGKR